MNQNDNPAALMASQLTEPNIIKKSLTVCCDTGKIVPDSTFWEMNFEGKCVGEECRCFRCSEIAKKSRGRLQI